MNRKNKKFVLILLSAIFLGVIAPSQNVALGANAAQNPFITGPLLLLCPTCAIILQAGGLISSGVSGMTKDIGAGIIGGALGLIATIPAALLEISQNLLSAVISPNFLGISMTGPDNVVVSYGWAITRDLANICLLLGLVIIGLGIILGIEEYQAKKTLPRLIAVALLINFTLVICGFILDFANLLMNYLLGAGSLSRGLSNEIQNGLATLAQNEAGRSLALVLTFFIFGMVAAVVYFLYALLFIARYVYLWILIIISPIAFASRVFPSLSNAKQFFPSFFHWDEWWKSFIQWATIGIYAAFFIAIANRLMTAMVSGAIVTTKLTALGSVFSYLFPLALLLIGFFSILDAGSSVPGFKKAGEYAKAGLTGAAVVTAGAAAGVAAGVTVGASKGAQEGRGVGRLTGAITGAAKGGVTAKGREEGARWYRKTAEKIPYVGPKPGTYESDLRKATNEEEKKLEKLDEKDLNYLAQNKTVLTREGNIRRAAALNVLSKRGKLNVNNSQYLENAQTFGLDTGEVLKHRPDMAPRFAKPGEEKTSIAKALNKQAAADFAKNVQVEALEDIEVLAAMDLKKVDEIGKKGSNIKTKALSKMILNRTLVDRKELELQRELSDARAGGTPEEVVEATANLKRFYDVINEIHSNPSYK